MSRRLQLVYIIFIALVICAVISHFLVNWLGIKVKWGGYAHYGRTGVKASSVVYGSSPAYDDLDWEEISKIVGGGIESWATAGSSPSEWEVMHRRSSNATRTFVALTPADVNEYYLCDFRAEIVPFSQTLQDLWTCGANRELCKRLLSQYPTAYVRKLFPTVGRSDGVMVGIRTKLRKLTGLSFGAEIGDAPKLRTTGKSEVTEKVSDWSEGHIQRQAVLMRAACMGEYACDGPKRQALIRLLQQSNAEGTVVLIVLPLPPIYYKVVPLSTMSRDFEQLISSLNAFYPKLHIIRLDHVNSLYNDNLFSDTVHLNMYGQQIATDALLRLLNTPAARIGMP